MVTLTRHQHSSLQQCEICLKTARIGTGRRCASCVQHQQWTEEALATASAEELRKALQHLVRATPGTRQRRATPHSSSLWDPVVQSWRIGLAVSQVWKFLLHLRHQERFPEAVRHTLERRHGLVWRLEGRRIRSFLPSPHLPENPFIPADLRGQLAVVFLADGEATGNELSVFLRTRFVEG